MRSSSTARSTTRLVVIRSTTSSRPPTSSCRCPAGSGKRPARAPRRAAVRGPRSPRTSRRRSATSLPRRLRRSPCSAPGRSPPECRCRSKLPREVTWVYDFAEGSRDMRELLGGKGANVAEMTRVLGPERVPAGFTITTEACVAYMESGREFPDGLEEQVREALGRLEEAAGKRLGDSDDPLLVSVRSGARESMPGMLDTVLNLGLNDVSVEGLARVTENDRFAWDSYRRFCQMFGNVCRGIAGERYEELIKERKGEAGVVQDVELGVDDLKALTARFKELFREETGDDFPQEPSDQLRQAIRAVFDSWMGSRAVEYRRINRIPDDWGTAVNVQQMVFGNKGDTSCSGVAFSRDEVTGAPEPSGDFLLNAQGEDVVSGVRTPRDLARMADTMPDAHAELLAILRTLEAH